MKSSIKVKQGLTELNGYGNRGEVQMRRVKSRMAACVAVLAGMGLAPTAAGAQQAVGLKGIPAPLLLEKAVTVPDVPTGPYAEPLTVDVAGGRVFGTPQAAKAVAVVDLNSGRLLRMIPGFSKLHGVIFDQASRRLFVSDGNTGEVKVFNGDDYSLVKVIPLAVGADAMAYDPRTHLIYVANGGEDAKMDHSLVSAIDPARLVKVADIRIASTDLEGIEIDPAKGKLYASLMEDSAIAVVDLKKGQQIATWKIPGQGHFPFPVVVDGTRNRLYVASREDVLTRERPVGSLFVFDTNSGRIVSSHPIGGWADGISFDRKRGRIYVSSGVGWINTFQIQRNNSLTRLPDVEIPLIAKCSFYSNELDRFFVDVPKLALTEAQVLEFKPAP